MKADADNLHQTFIELAKIPSPSRRERLVADHITRIISSLGYVVEEDDAGDAIGGNAGNLLVSIPATGDGPKLFLAAHMDTVESGETAIAPEKDGDNIISAGPTITGADDKCGVTVLLEVLRLLKDQDISHGELLVAFTVGEEIELVGIGAMDSALYAGYDAGIMLDHSQPDEIVVGAPAKIALRAEVIGVGGHGAFPEKRINAAHVLAKALSRLPSGRLDEYSTANLGIMQSGTAINVIPETAYVEYEIRSHRKALLDFHLKRSLGILEGAVRESRVYVSDELEDEKRLKSATIEVEVEVCYEAYRHKNDSLPVKLLSDAISKAGMTPLTVIAQGGSDSNVLNARGLPSVVLGCGMHGAHSKEEYATISEMVKATEVILAAGGTTVK